MTPQTTTKSVTYISHHIVTFFVVVALLLFASFLFVTFFAKTVCCICLCMQHDDIKLNNEHFLPCIGLDTQNLDTQEKVDAYMSAALQIGYRYFDTAAVNKNAAYIGDFLYRLFKSGAYKREDIFVGYKLWNADHFCVKEALTQFLDDCNLTHVDYLYIHWPVSFVKQDGVVVCKDNMPVTQPFRPVRVWLEMERMVDLALAKSIGVCSFGPRNYNKLLTYGNFVPAMIQLECHPHLRQDKMIDICGQNGTVVVAYTPLGLQYNNFDKLEHDQTLICIAQKYKITVSKLVYSYLRMKNYCILVNCATPQDLKDNYTQIMLDSIDFDTLDNMQVNKRYFDPQYFGSNIFE